jgi:twitching motility protein PilT
MAEIQINRLLDTCITRGASDLHLKAGVSPRVRIRGEIQNIPSAPLTRQEVESLVFEILTPIQKQSFLEHGTLDFAHEIDDEHRFRINVFHQRGVISLAARRVSAYVPSFEALHLPLIMEKIADTNQGLVLVVGPTGCGKTTTIAAMIDYISRTRSCHIITIEDPIEYLYKDQKAIVSQREIGLDVPDYDDALRYLMRQDPDVVFIGEMRDYKTVTAGMRAAETGHLVFGTVHSANASQTVHRLLELFPQAERNLARQTLAISIRAIVSQILLPSIKEGIDRIPAVEIMLTNPAVKKLISEEREGDLPSVIRSSQQEGMQDLTDNLCQLVKDGSVDPKDAYRYAPNKEELKMALKGIRTTAEGIL